MSDRIFVSETDYQKLRLLLEGRHSGYAYNRPYLDKLEQELDRAEIVESCVIDPDIVTMNSEVRLRDLDSGTVVSYKLVYPGQLRSENDISVLAPIGTALLGYRAKDIVEWPVPKGMRRFQIVEVVNQPEVAQLAMLS